MTALRNHHLLAHEHTCTYTHTHMHSRAHAGRGILSGRASSRSFIAPTLFPSIKSRSSVLWKRRKSENLKKIKTTMKTKEGKNEEWLKDGGEDEEEWEEEVEEERSKSGEEKK